MFCRFPETVLLMFGLALDDEMPIVAFWKSRCRGRKRVGQSRLPDTWISFQDFIKGTPERDPDPGPAREPEQSVASNDWTDAEDYLIHGVRPAKPVVVTDRLFVTLKEPAPKPPVPEEAGLTIYDAMRQIYAVYGPKNAIFSRLRRLEQQDKRELDSGRIDQQEFERRAVATAIIRENHGRRMEKITRWYLDNYFRLFDNPEPVVVPDKSSH
ncbi:MAG: hypothetical protein HQL74_08970 [Magnetococcales bacterium]|nr:hypothetical protein [Magnetococcales bacterium]